LRRARRYAKIPYLYGEGNESLDAGRLTPVEVEGGGALTNYRG
jgi:hypothetical protein